VWLLCSVFFHVRLAPPGSVGCLALLAAWLYWQAQKRLLAASREELEEERRAAAAAREAEAGLAKDRAEFERQQVNRNRALRKPETRA